MLFRSANGRSIMGGGGGYIHVFVFIDCMLKQSISKETNWAEHRCMNVRGAMNVG